MILLKGVGAFFLLWAFLVLGMGLGCTRLPTSGVPAEVVAEP